MARLPRLFVPGCSHHVIQRGNNRAACFSVYLALGGTPEARQENYRELFAREIGRVALEEIRECTNKSWALGSEKFKDEIRAAANRRIESQGWGGDRRSRSLTP